MATLIGIPEDKMKIIQLHVEQIRNSTNMEVFKSMYAKMKLTFGEANIQIKRIDEDYVLETLAAQRWDTAVIRSQHIDNLRSQIRGSCSNYELIIRFPQIVITNGRNNTTIHDLFVRLLARPNGTLVAALQGTVATFTKAHALANYLHSHLVPQAVRERPPVFGQFCLGEGEISQVLTLLSRSYNEINFAMLCIHIRNFVEWESLVGVPHIKMSNIPNLSSNPAPVPSLLPFLIANIASQLVTKFRELPISEARGMVTLSADDVSILVDPTDQLSIWAARTIQSNLHFFNTTPNAVDTLLAYRDLSGRYISCIQPSSINDMRPPNGTVLKFRGEDIKVKFIDNNINQNSTKYANPKIIEQFCAKLAEELTSAAIDNAENGNSDPSSNIGEATVTNSDPVREDSPT